MKFWQMQKAHPILGTMELISQDKIGLKIIALKLLY